MEEPRVKTVYCEKFMIVKGMVEARTVCMESINWEFSVLEDN